MFETTEPVERAADDAGQIVGDREQRDDQLRRVAEARVQESADAGAGVLARHAPLLRRSATRVGSARGPRGRRAPSRRARRRTGASSAPGVSTSRAHRILRTTAASLVTLVIERRSLRLEQHARPVRRGTTSCSPPATAQRLPRSGAPTTRDVHGRATGASSCVDEAAAGATTPTLLRELLGDVRRRARPVRRRRARGVATGDTRCSARRRRCSTSLRARGLKTGVVANSWPEPARLLRGGRRGVRARRAVRRRSCSRTRSDSGSRSRRSSCRALDELDVDPSDAMFVGDRLATDMQGAADAGHDDRSSAVVHAQTTDRGIEPDFMAFTPMDVLNCASRRLAL